MERHDLIINGSGSYGGGVFNKIKIRGEGTITSDFDCLEFKASGSGEILKNGAAGRFDVIGETEVRGDLKADKLKVIGSVSVGGTAVSKRANVWGTLEVGDRFSGEEARIKGNLTVKGDAEFERFYSTGAFEISGLLNAGEININPRFGTSSADEIGGEKIIVKRKISLFFLHKSKGMVEARVIEGDEIFLESTKAEIVRGKHVHIGAGCEIGMVEYQEEFTVNEDAKVKEHRKVR